MLRLVGLALAGFAATAWLLAAGLPLYIAPSRTRDAYEHFTAHRDRYDTLFFGSSRTHFQLVPAVFDAAMAERGAATRSLNLGVYSMNGLSTEAFLEQIQALEPRGRRWVFIDPGELWRA